MTSVTFVTHQQQEPNGYVHLGMMRKIPTGSTTDTLPGFEQRSFHKLTRPPSNYIHPLFMVCSVNRDEIHRTRGKKSADIRLSTLLCNVQQKSLYQFLKISFKFKKCAISNKSIQNGRPSRSPKKDKKEPKKAREPRKNPRNPRGQCQRPQKN